jgi:hypothetical protein
MFLYYLELSYGAVLQFITYCPITKHSPHSMLTTMKKP